MTGIGTAESDWEQFAAEILGELGWQTVSGRSIGPGSGERDGWDDLVLHGKLYAALRRLNPDVPDVYLRQALAEIVAARSNDAISENLRVHEWLMAGFRGITYTDDDGQETTPTIRLLSTDPAENTWLVASQVTIRRAEYHRRFDLALYCNGMPVGIVELKKAGSASADIASAHAQLQTYVREFPTAFRFAVFTVISDGLFAKYGTPFTELNHFAPWNVDDDGEPHPPEAESSQGGPLTGLESTLFGVCHQLRFLQLLRWYTAFDEGAGGLFKRIAKPHQYFAVARAFEKTVQAAHSDGKAGVVWHTQGSGKSMEMELYTNRIMRAPELANPTVVVITDRKELDGQLFGAFAISRLLPERPTQVRRRADLRTELTDRTTGGILFTTLQKFGKTREEREAGRDHPLLTARRNVVVIVDEAHRSHYDDLDGYARHLKDALPEATLIAFTGTPISFADRNTRDTFGDYIDVYDLTRAVADGATVPVYFAPRLVKMSLRGEVSQEDLDRAADDATVGLDDVEREQLERSVAVVNAVYGHPDRIAVLVNDLLDHWDARTQAMAPLIGAPGKALLVGGTREICARLYEAIVARRPGWHSDELDHGRIKVVYSGDATDTGIVARHVRRESENAVIKERLRDVDDELEIVIVKDMMLTGYDSPPMHTLYLDRPLQGALLMQTLARVNRHLLR
jgi:type I restriction enzyme, R subunit